MSEASIIEHLRLQEGRLFQNESTLALYLDVKAVVTEAITSNRDAPERLASLTDDETERLLDLLLSLAPRGVRDYHSKSLHECIKMVAKLLWPSHVLLVARPRVSTLLQGMLKRLAANGTVRQYHELDPIKQDFVVREAFRRCLVNDCLIVFDGPEEASEDSDVGPDDSASQFVGARPSGAHSTLGPVDDGPVGPVAAGGRDESAGPAPGDDGVSVVRDGQSVRDGKSVRDTPSVVRSVAPEERRDGESVAPKVVTVQDNGSAVSRRSSSGSIASSVLRRPLNVRKIHIDTVPEEA